MATGKAQRIGIWVITVVMLVGTLGSFAVLIIGNQNQNNDQINQQKKLDEFEAQQKADSAKKSQTSEPFGNYVATPFDAASVKDLQKAVLVQGEGASVKKSDIITISYFGWIPDGRIFDSSKQKDKDDAPISYILSGLIPGWQEGLEGEKVGSTVELTIPEAKAYGPTGSGIIEPNTPLKFIIKIDDAKESEAIKE